MLSGQESRNQFNENLFTQETKTILERMFGLTLPGIPHGDTLAHLWKKLPPEALEKLRLAMVYRLPRSRYLERLRYGKRYLLARDGTELYRWKERHCAHCRYAAFIFLMTPSPMPQSQPRAIETYTFRPSF
jgi:hypothetical protein